MEVNAELGEFLRSRRARLDPAEAGARPGSSVRRVPGLRREEVALLAGVSVDYYSRLEQGRSLNVSAEILDAVSRALQLGTTERAYLFQIARPGQRRARRRAVPRVQRVRPGIWRILETLDEVTPALVLGRRMDILAANRLARALIADFTVLPVRERNLLRFCFLNEASRELYVDWAEVARENVAILRLDAGRHPDDPQLAELVGELAVKSEQFRQWWAEHDVHERSHGRKRYHHPVVGDLTLAYESVALPGDRDQTLCIYTAEAASPSEATLKLLASWTSQCNLGQSPVGEPAAEQSRE